MQPFDFVIISSVFAAGVRWMLCLDVEYLLLRFANDFIIGVSCTRVVSRCEWIMSRQPMGLIAVFHIISFN